jgi:putative SOS response-associated peptidase YedK
MFRSAAPKQRCLIFVNGFYEWRWKDEKGKVKTPYFIYMPNHEPFAMGGLYIHWHGPDEQVYKTYAITTAPANPLMERIHNNKKRMPLILDKDRWDAWLNPDVAQDEIQEVMKPYPDVLQAHTISKNITKKGFDTNVPEIQETVLPDSLF